MSFRAWLLVALTALLGACQSMPPPVPEEAAQQTRIATPFFPQQDYQCGPAALATVLGWSGLDVDDQQLVEEVWLPNRRGSLALEMNAAARARGRLVYPINTPEQLFISLHHQQPVLVMQNLALERWPRWHFAVVTGYRDDGNTLVLNSDTRETLQVAWNRFVRTWARARYQGWLVLPPGELPAQAAAIPLVQSLEDLARTAGPEMADPFWHPAAASFSDSFLMQFAYGNHLWATGKVDEAIKAFRQATQIRPDDPAGWQNLIIALHRSGCARAARQALEQGRDTMGSTSLSEDLLSPHPGPKNTDPCPPGSP